MPVLASLCLRSCRLWHPRSQLVVTWCLGAFLESGPGGTVSAAPHHSQLAGASPMPLLGHVACWGGSVFWELGGLSCFVGRRPFPSPPCPRPSQPHPTPTTGRALSLREAGGPPGSEAGGFWTTCGTKCPGPRPRFPREQCLLLVHSTRPLAVTSVFLRDPSPMAVVCDSGLAGG